MSILSALSEKRHDNKNLAELAKLPQALIMQMGQRKELSQEEIAMIISKKAEMIESAARQKALSEVAGGQMPSVIEQKMATIAQAENPAPPQQMMPQQMAQAPQLPEDVGIAQNPTPPMQLAGGGIIAFDEGGDVDVDPDDEYQDLLDQAQEDETNQNIFDLIAEMGSGANVGIMAGENRNIKQDTRERAMDSAGNMVDRLRAQIMQKESGGRRYDKDGNLLTSSKGALGEMQVMPATARDPGFGIKPARNNSPDELRRVGDEYVNVLLNRYQDPKLAMIAYNMGPGATDKWLASGADPRRLPKETQGYIRGVNLAEGGEVKRFQAGGLGSEFGDTEQTYDMDTLRVQEAIEAKKRKEYEDQYNFLKENAPGTAAKMKPPVTKPATNQKASANNNYPSEQEFRDFDQAAALFQAENMGKQNSTPRAEAEEETFNLMKYIRDRQARADKLAESDKWQAGLAAGLGMLGGTSQYALENIGKGGQLGVQQLGQLQKLRASQDIASDKMLGTAYNAEVLGKLRKDQLAQGNSVRYANALNSVREERVKQTGKYLEKPEYMDLGMLQTYAQRLAKDPNDKEARAKYNSLLTKKQSLEDKIKRDLPDPDPSLYGVSGGSNSMKIVGVR